MDQNLHVKSFKSDEDVRGKLGMLLLDRYVARQSSILKKDNEDYVSVYELRSV